MKLRCLLCFVGRAPVIGPCIGQETALHLATSDAEARLFGVELDVERAPIASTNGIETGNSFDVIARFEFFSLLYLNPPYDS